jgi:hypothetical protein
MAGEAQQLANFSDKLRAPAHPCGCSTAPLRAIRNPDPVERSQSRQTRVAKKEKRAVEVLV